MWNACCPGASPETVSVILTPSGVCVSSAVPTFLPRECTESAFAMVAAFWAVRVATERNRTARLEIKLFMAFILLLCRLGAIISVDRDGFKETRCASLRRICRKNIVHPFLGRVAIET